MGKNLKGKELGLGYSQRKDGRYEARALVNGVKIHLYNNSLIDLKEKFEKEKARLLRQEKGVRPNLLLGEWIDEWLERVKKPQLKNEVSASVYERHILNTYKRHLGIKKIEYVTHMDIQTATYELEKEGYSKKYIKVLKGYLIHYFSSFFE